MTPTSTGFVTFHTKRAAVLCSQSNLSANENTFNVGPAPEPRVRLRLSDRKTRQHSAGYHMAESEAQRCRSAREDRNGGFRNGAFAFPSADAWHRR